MKTKYRTNLHSVINVTVPSESNDSCIEYNGKWVEKAQASDCWLSMDSFDRNDRIFYNC